MDTTFATGMVTEENSVRATLGGGEPLETPVANSALIGPGHGAGGDLQTGRNEPHETPAADLSTLLPEKPRYKATDSSLARANARQPVVQAFDALIRAGESQASAHHHLTRRGLDVPLPTLRNWWLSYRDHGYQGLMGKSHLAGRPSAVARLVNDIGHAKAEEIIKTIAATAHDTQSAVMATRLVGRSDSIPAEFADMIDYREDGKPRRSKHNLPKSFRDKIRINGALALKHQGNRAAELRGLSTPRRVDVFPGDIYTSDDTTPIWGWWVPWEHALGNPAYDKASCEYRFGVKLMQGQLLPVMDFASNYVFMAALIARETAAYRAEDIAALYGRVFAMQGLPRIGFQFERGTWESNILMGVKVDVTEGDLTLTHRVGGLQMLPSNITAAHREMHGADFPFPKNLQIFQSFLPKTKPIEAAFDRLQTVEGMLWGNLGRDQMRRPNERTKKQFEACKRGSADPRLHFLSAEELIARLTPLYDFVNTERMEGQVFRGVPKNMWDRSVSDHPLYHLPEESQYLFRRNWSVARITRGMIALKRKDAHDNTSTEYYCHPEEFLPREGRQVLAYWDHEDVESPAQIHDPETRKLVCLADHQDRVGAFLDITTSGHDIKRRYRNAKTVQYADIHSRAPSRQLPQEIADRRAAATGQPRNGQTLAASAPKTTAGEPSSRSNLDAYRTSNPDALTMRTIGNAPASPRNSAANDPRMAEFLGMEE